MGDNIGVIICERQIELPSLQFSEGIVRARERTSEEGATKI